MSRIGIVVPWFGQDLKGGAEQQAWQIATRLASRGYKINVLTTCCEAFNQNWGVNHYKAGESQEKGITIHRFQVNPRDDSRFSQVNARMLSLPTSNLKPGVPPTSVNDSSIFVDENINSSDLLSYLCTHKHQYSTFIFIPYLYGPILKGLPIVADRAYLQPCLHDEIYAYLPEVEHIFRMARGLLFNSEGEALLAFRLYGPSIIQKSIIVGEGIEFHEGHSNQIEHIGSLSLIKDRFILYLGRRDSTKNTDLLIRAYKVFKECHPTSKLKLVLAGPGDLDANSFIEGILDLGLVNEAEKVTLLTNCIALFQPSRNESFSRVIMEAWLHGRPVAANRECLATALAVKKTGGGWLAFSDTEWADLFAQVDAMDEKDLAAFGKKGQCYANDIAVWDKVIDRYADILKTSKTINTSHPCSGQRLKEIHQLLPNLSLGDAISNHALSIRNFLRNLGYKSDIFVRYLDEQLQSEARVFQPKEINKQAGLLYHHSIGSELTDYAVIHPGPKCLIYHNITPAEFFEPYRPEFAKLLLQGREELSKLAPSFKLSVGDSKYNAQELSEKGFKNPGVLSISVDPNNWNSAPDPKWMDWLQDGRKNILFVGRLSPNKCQHHLIQAFSSYLLFDPSGRLLLVGSGEHQDPYVRYLCHLTDQLGLKKHVIFTGRINEDQLQACYRTAHLFWSMSEHEGFCVPLIEAMWFDIPVLAYKSTVVPETLGDAAMMFTDKSLLNEISALGKLMVHDVELREKILQQQRKRREAFLSSALKYSYERLVLILEEGIDRN